MMQIVPRRCLSVLRGIAKSIPRGMKKRCRQDQLNGLPTYGICPEVPLRCCAEKQSAKRTSHQENNGQIIIMQIVPKRCLSVLRGIAKSIPRGMKKQCRQDQLNGLPSREQSLYLPDFTITIPALIAKHLIYSYI
jgi:hypothetical protein